MKKVLVTGAAGFIGSHLLRALRAKGADVYGIDNFSSGFKENLPVGLSHRIFPFDITNHAGVYEVFKVVKPDVVFHQAARGSIPRSLQEPTLTWNVNVNGFANILEMAKEFKVQKVVYASSSSVFGTPENQGRSETQIKTEYNNPYSLSKRVNELQGAAFQKMTGIPCVGLRYFNVYGPNQNHCEPYAAVIPKWLRAIAMGKTEIIIRGSKNSRDFTHVDNVVHANILAATNECHYPVYNVGTGQTTSLGDVWNMICANLEANYDVVPPLKRIVYPEAGETTYSRADITLIRKDLDYEPVKTFAMGLYETVDHYLQGSGIRRKYGSEHKNGGQDSESHDHSFT